MVCPGATPSYSTIYDNHNMPLPLQCLNDHLGPFHVLTRSQFFYQKSKRWSIERKMGPGYLNEKVELVIQAKEQELNSQSNDKWEPVIRTRTQELVDRKRSESWSFKRKISSWTIKRKIWPGHSNEKAGRSKERWELVIQANNGSWSFKQKSRSCIVNRTINGSWSFQRKSRSWTIKRKIGPGHSKEKARAGRSKEKWELVIQTNNGSWTLGILFWAGQTVENRELDSQ